MPTQVLLRLLARLWLSRWAFGRQCAHRSFPHAQGGRSCSGGLRDSEAPASCAANAAGLAAAKGLNPCMKTFSASGSALFLVVVCDCSRLLVNGS